MPPSLIPSPQTVAAIDKHIDRLLKDLGNPPAPLRLEDVRELLRLDLRHYSSTDTTWLQDKVHLLRVARKQIAARPTLLVDVVKKLNLKALVLPDRGRILINQDLPSPKQRWSETHEIIHNVLPWHQGVSFGDRDRTLSPTCHQLVECEANYGAGRLLFLGPTFAEQVRSAPVDLDRIKALSKLFGNSMTTTLWRAVETLDEPTLGLVSTHPRSAPTGNLPRVRYFIRSRRFSVQFANITDESIFRAVSKFCYGRRGPIGENDVVLSDVDGEEHVFHMACFCNSYDTLTLGIYKQKRGAFTAT